MNLFEDIPTYQITKIEESKGRGKYRILYLNGKKFGKFFDEIIFRFNIKEDSFLNENELKQLQKVQSEMEAEKIALNYLSYKPRSINEVKKKLFSKKIAYSVIDLTIEKMKKYGYLDDKKYARDWIEERIRTRGFSPSKIKSELFLKGISKEIIENNLKEIYTPELEIKTAKRIAKKQMRKYKNLDNILF